MSRLIRNKKIYVILVLIYIFVMGQIAQAFAGEPGSSSDPLVTKSYVDNQISILKSSINTNTNTTSPTQTPSSNTENVSVTNEEIATLQSTIEILRNDLLDMQIKIRDLESSNQVNENSYRVVEVPAGSSIFFKASVEVIVRAGEAKAISGEMGGLADLTDDAGIELITGDAVPKNHLIIISRDDSRGMKAVTKLYILIKGEYTIK